MSSSPACENVWTPPFATQRASWDLQHHQLWERSTHLCSKPSLVKIHLFPRRDNVVCCVYSHLHQPTLPSSPLSFAQLDQSCCLAKSASTPQMPSDCSEELCWSIPDSLRASAAFLQNLLQKLALPKLCSFGHPGCALPLLRWIALCLWYIFWETMAYIHHFCTYKWVDKVSCVPEMSHNGWTLPFSCLPHGDLPWIQTGWLFSSELKMLQMLVNYQT